MAPTNPLFPDVIGVHEAGGDGFSWKQATVPHPAENARLLWVYGDMYLLQKAEGSSKIYNLVFNQITPHLSVYVCALSLYIRCVLKRKCG